MSSDSDASPEVKAYRRRSIGSMIANVLMVLMVLSVAVVGSAAMGTVLVACTERVARWLSLSPSHVLWASAASLLVLVLAVATVTIAACLHEIRDSIEGEAEYSEELLGQLALAELVESSEDTQAAARRNRRRSRH